MLSIILLLLCICYSFHQLAQYGGHFSFIEDDMGDGVPNSYSRKPHPPQPDRPKFNKALHSSTVNPPPTFYGHGAPLRPDPPKPFENPLPLPHHLNLECSPECCPSPYSCDRGCVCASVESISKLVKGK